MSAFAFPVEFERIQQCMCDDVGARNIRMDAIPGDVVGVAVFENAIDTALDVAEQHLFLCADLSDDLAVFAHTGAHGIREARLSIDGRHENDIGGHRL